MKKSYIMVGCPGSGKSTWGKNNAIGFVHCSADNFFIKNGSYEFDVTKLYAAHTKCLNDYKNAIDLGQDVIVDNTNTRLKEIRPYYDYAKQNGYDVTIIMVMTDPDIAASRNVHGVPKDKVKEMYDRIKNLSFPGEWDINIIKI